MIPLRRPATLHGLVACAAIALGLAGVTRGQAAEPEGTPFRLLAQALQPAIAARDLDRLVAVQHIESKLPGVRPESIEIVLKTRAGDRRVPVAADGTVAFPLDAGLLAEDPRVVTNQPRGSLTLSVTLSIRLPAASRIATRDLEAALAQIDTLIARQGGDGRRARGIEFRFPGRDATLTLRGDTERVLIADAEGRVLTMRAGDLDTAREIEFNRRPIQALPYLGR